MHYFIYVFFVWFQAKGGGEGVGARGLEVRERGDGIRLKSRASLAVVVTDDVREMTLQWDKLSPGEFQQLQDLASCKYSIHLLI